jgi:hypothetical protein
MNFEDCWFSSLLKRFLSLRPKNLAFTASQHPRKPQLGTECQKNMWRNLNLKADEKATSDQQPRTLMVSMVCAKNLEAEIPTHTGMPWAVWKMAEASQMWFRHCPEPAVNSVPMVKSDQQIEGLPKMGSSDLISSNLRSHAPSAGPLSAEGVSWGELHIKAQAPKQDLVETGWGWGW